MKKLDMPARPNVWIGVTVESAKHLGRIGILRTIPAAKRFVSFEPLLGWAGDLDLTGIDWAIVGCETGPGARPTDRIWVRDILNTCRKQGVAFFLKKLTPRDKTINDLPIDLRIREIP